MGGFFVLLPIGVVLGIIIKGTLMMKGLSDPIAHLFPKTIVNEPKFPVLLAAILLAVLCFVCGLFMRSALIRAEGVRFERMLLWRFPGYRAIKGMARGMAGSADAGDFKPVMLVSSQGFREFAYLIEDNENDNVTVMIPSSPSAISGTVRIVSRDRIEPLNASLAEVASVLGQFGVGAQDLLAKANSAGTNEKKHQATRCPDKH